MKSQVVCYSLQNVTKISSLLSTTDVSALSKTIKHTKYTYTSQLDESWTVLSTSANCCHCFLIVVYILRRYFCFPISLHMTQTCSGLTWTHIHTPNNTHTHTHAPANTHTHWHLLHFML